MVLGNGDGAGRLQTVGLLVHPLKDMRTDLIALKTLSAMAIKAHDAVDLYTSAGLTKA
jgi:hypothetical protein